MLNFFDSLQIATMFAVHEFFEEQNRQNLYQQRFQQQCLEAVTDAGAEMCDIIVNTIMKNYGNSNIPQCLADGIYDLPISAMLEVSKAQNCISKKQEQLLDMFFSSLNTKYKKRDFKLALKGLGSLDYTMQKSIGLSTNIGAFWNPFFSLIRKEGSVPNTLGKIVECYAEIVQNYMCLGNDNQYYIADDIIKCFIYNLNNRFEESIKNTYVDLIDEKTILEHKNTVINESYNLIRNSGDEGEFDNNELIITLIETGLYNLIELTHQPIHIKAEMLQYAFDIANVLEFDGYQVYKELNEYPDLKESYSIFPINILSIYCVMGEKGNVNPTKIISEFVNFLLGVNRELSKKYGNKYQVDAQTYCSNLIQKVIDK